MIRIILFLVLIALAAAGAAWVADQTGDVVLSWGGWRAETTLPVFVLALGIVVVAATMVVDDLARAVAHAGAHPPQAGASGVTPAAVMPSRKACLRSAMAIPPPPARMPKSRAAMPGTIRWRCCCTRNRRSSMATARARSAPSAPWPSARIRGCWACAACSSRRSAPTIPLRP